MMTDSFSTPAGVVHDAIRSFLAVFDRVFYGLLGFVYQLFFNVASSEIFSNDMIMKFYSRVQLILGVFMMFQLAMVILRGIMNPDEFTKEGSGAGNLIRRVITALFLLTALVPISIPSPQNEYERQLNNNGLLFGTLYSLQYRVLANNTIGRLIMGTNDSSASYISTGDEENSSDSLESASRIFTSTILKTFVRINLKPEYDRPEHCNTDDNPAESNECRMCTSGVDDYIALYSQVDVDPSELLDHINATCSVNFQGLAHSGIPGAKLISEWADNELYVFNYSPILSMITAGVFIFIMLSFTIDIGIRAIKLAILRLIAPIPIISYMDPKGSKDSAFNAWVKTLTSTYLDLFLRLAIVYFVLFLVQKMLLGQFSIAGSGVLKALTIVALAISLFAFAKQAPKFIKQAIGIKDGDFKLFGGLGAIGTAAGIAASIPGAIGSGIASARASKMADQTREAFGDVAPGTSDRLRNKAKHLVAGITGAAAGGFTGAKAAATAKEKGFNASVEAMRKRNQDVLARGNDGSTLLGRMGSSARNMFMGEGKADDLARQVQTNKGRIDALKAIQSRVKGEMVKKDWTQSIVGKYDDKNKQWNYYMKDTSGAYVDGAINYKDFTARKNAAAAAGKDTFEIATSTGNRTITMADAERYQGLILKGNENDYITQHTSGTVTEDSRLLTLIHEAKALGGSAEFIRKDGDIDFAPNGKSVGITDRESIWNAIEGFEDYNTKLNRKNAINKANDKFSGKK